MTVEQAVCEQLLSQSAVTTLVSTRVYQLRLPQDGDLPAIRVQLIDEPEFYHLRGGSVVHRTRIQTDAYAEATSGADPYAVASSVADAIHDALSGVQFNAGSPTDLMVTGAFRTSRRPIDEAEELREVRILQEYIVWSRVVS